MSVGVTTDQKQSKLMISKLWSIINSWWL